MHFNAQIGAQQSQVRHLKNHHHGLIELFHFDLTCTHNDPIIHIHSYNPFVLSRVYVVHTLVIFTLRKSNTLQSIFKLCITCSWYLLKSTKGIFLAWAPTPHFLLSRSPPVGWYRSPPWFHHSRRQISHLNDVNSNNLGLSIQSRYELIRNEQPKKKPHHNQFYIFGNTLSLPILPFASQLYPTRSYSVYIPISHQ